MQTRSLLSILLTTIVGLGSSSLSHAADPLKPYVLFILDTSGSMDGATGSGPPSCGGADTRINHAKCAINNIANSYGDIVFALSQFRTTVSGTPGTNCVDCDKSAVNCSACDESNGSGCTPAMTSDSQLQMLTGLVEGNNFRSAIYTDNVCTVCSTDYSLGAEVLGSSVGWTPLAGALKGAKRYWSGLQSAEDSTVIWPSTEPGFSPIFNDPTKDAFLPSGGQCRPYITILLTDGEETCTTFSNTTAAAASLLTTTVGPRTYRIVTKPIGFGVTPGSGTLYNQVESIAHAGGATNVAGVNEGSYAKNEEELQLAISQIIADSVRSEVCNSADDDCDTRVDEDFPSLGLTCNNGLQGVCRGTGVYQCSADGTGTVCNLTNPGGTATPEVCDGLDNDCDGVVDDGVCIGCGDVEVCNNVDDDCDNRVDEDLVRACGSSIGECRPGTETCQAGTWGQCTGTTATPEICDGRDNNCDGTVDGLSRECSDLPGGNPNRGICRPGIQTCPVGGSAFGACLGEVVPRAEGCNNIDDDCDGLIDEGTGGASCGTTCGVGVTVCMNGALQCNATQAQDDTTCDGVDDDCDNIVDENVVDGAECDANGTICGGTMQCIQGTMQCTGGAPVLPEICDCQDNDCDELTDEPPSGDDPPLCPAGAQCRECQCAFECGPGEFPCPVGKVCSAGFCVVDKCFGVTCGPDGNGNATRCEEGECKPACDIVQCTPPLVCFAPTGTCEPDSCETFPARCTANEMCVGGTCVADPCTGVTCEAGQFCAGGTCQSSCAGVECKLGEVCRLGACVATQCENGCPAGSFCNEMTGRCDQSRCPPGSDCGVNQVCNPQTGECEADPCLGIACPTADQVCFQGSCYDKNNLPPDGTGEQRVTAAGGSGCSSGQPTGLWMVLGIGVLVGLRWRRGRRGVLVLAAGALSATSLSCTVNDYCINCNVAGDGRLDGGAVSDGATGDGMDGPTQCVPSGPEVCDGKDNDCDGGVDNGPLPTVGDACGTEVGECTTGVVQCTAGQLKCSGVGAAPEQCDNLDNDCDGAVDNGDPGGGAACGTNAGECTAGVNRCVGGQVTCVGAIGTPGAVAEICDGRDNDCDNSFDEGLSNLGSCGMTDEGACSLGMLMCSGGVPTCVGDVGPSFELCDNIDQDCDGNPSNGYDLQNDPRNCGNCGNICNLPNATEACRTGSCAIGNCDQNYFNNDGDAGNGCEYGPCTFRGPTESCNGFDDNCNGSTDENLTAPNICQTAGACAGATAMCSGTGGWQCNYGSNVSQDANGDIVPETACDGIDNDCDGQVDEGDPDKGQACDNGLQGVCRATGVYVCAADPNAPVTCQYTVPGSFASTEVCDGKDNDCDGMIDDGAATGNLGGQEWVTIGGTQIMKYEASRPDATATRDGSSGAAVCSRPGVLPWVNVKQGQAAAACASIGARLCTELEWHRACTVAPGTSWPLTGPTSTVRAVFEAENYFAALTATASSVVRAWVPDQTPGFSGYSALRASPNTGANVSAANAATQSPRLDYQMTFTTTGSHYVWVRMFSPTGADDTIWVNINSSATSPASSTAVQLVTPTNGGWVWVRSNSINVPSTGVYYVNIWMREDGTKIDRIAVAKDNGTTAPNTTTGPYNTWAYASNANTPSDTTCNAQPYDTNGALAGNQDDNLATGTLSSCYANGGGVNTAFDMSGNVREWTAPRLPGANPIRGGAANTTVEGTSCDLAFTLANDDFFFPNVGFRCCR